MVHKARHIRVLTAASLLIFAVRAAWAVDGSLVITQSYVNSTGGFPFKINASGSYTLGSNLTVPAGNGEGGIACNDGCNISYNVVNNNGGNLNGFSIIGPGGLGLC
jgi:hypothetical protein